jgi:midasin (ATPase involved in ribosome maturation)
MAHLSQSAKSEAINAVVEFLKQNPVKVKNTKDLQRVIETKMSELVPGTPNREISERIAYITRKDFMVKDVVTKMYSVASVTPIKPSVSVRVPSEAPVVEQTVQKVFSQPKMQQQEVVYVPEVDPNYVRNGNNIKTIESVLQAGQFFPIFITGLSGNGKTLMVEQVCAKLNRPMVRVQITPETDESDLIGGYQLVDGNTVFQEGPVMQALKTPNCVLLIDEIDRGSNKIMALQGILEGKPYMNKKTGEIVKLAQGVNVIATANTKGQGDDTGSFSAASIIDEAFLERFAFTIEQDFPSQAAEKRILQKVDPSMSDELAHDLTKWAMVIRKTYADEAIEDVISTRRLVHIVRTNMIIGDINKSIELCVSRFEASTKESFIDLYSKIKTYEDAPEQAGEPAF